MKIADHLNRRKDTRRGGVVSQIPLTHPRKRQHVRPLPQTTRERQSPLLCRIRERVRVRAVFLGPFCGKYVSVCCFSMLFTLFFAVLSGCAATSPRVVEVTATRRTKTVERVDKDLFLTDRASIIDFQPQSLPSSEQREEFFVRWTGAGVDRVKFEYRQVNVPNTVMEQTCASQAGSWHVFEIRGDHFINGGPVSAWRVSLWNDSQPRSERGKLLAEEKSVLW